MKEIVANITNMSKSFPTGEGDFWALKNINLSFERGEFSGFVGPSGSGKTTLLNILGSLDTPSKGEVEVLGNQIHKINQLQAARLRSRHIGFIFQTYNLLPVYNVYENVEFPLLLMKMDANKRDKMVKEAIEWVGLSDKVKSRPNQLSGGQCQRVAIARAMVKKPDLVLADEPTANLDTENSLNILDTMFKLNRELSTTFIFSTHDPKVIDYLKRVIRLTDGEVASDDPAPGI
ncbi:MAG: ABC transporter ATP-binding protein [Candidatus Cloacimonadales bacterium]|jgi:putative ABC transport system ATP-binding protein|nr:ABC transporter ATP-binding protein [Candidatus Cloacimonadota bacterium]MDY0381570.1 ABC transporter ATP-binding protein [Candidatus Cloacimonadaceae bacterium]HCM14585.1 lipoprotein-releasing system ATP-binding protein LolD [Candidatus Cloacimonas sp.]MCB5264041.1 ABC transporter ATP-binding protein [Candidatus Cloacimonadota bacterium]MCB5277181.1 ABC transporter ATP-binding protein [Candidatus Cloacimonadota bacterium]